MANGSIGIDLIGEQEIKRMFSKLTSIEQKKFFIEEFRSVGTNIVSAIKNSSPVSAQGTTGNKKIPTRNHAPGNLRRSVAMLIGRGRDFPTVFIGPNKAKGVDAYYNHMVIGGHEYGSSKVPANPFVRRAWESISSFATETIRSKMKSKLDKLMK